MPDTYGLLCDLRLGLLLLPIVFMLHDFEELIWMRPWLRRQDARFWARIPPRLQTPLRQLLALSPERFTRLVAYEFVLLSASALWATSGAAAALIAWFGALAIFTLHLLAHIGQALFVRRPLPPLLSSLLALPYCVWALFRFMELGLFSRTAAPYLALSPLLWLAAVVVGFRAIGGIGRKEDL